MASRHHQISVSDLPYFEGFWGVDQIRGAGGAYRVLHPHLALVASSGIPVPIFDLQRA